MRLPDVTVLIVTYNSDLNKLYRTLYSVLRQKNVIFEIVISDDGSDSFESAKIEKYLLSRGCGEFSIMSSEKNFGTVINIQKGLSVSKGKYVCSISPGDFFYGEKSLSEIYEYANKYDLESVFGVPLLYNSDLSEKVKFYPKFIPMFPKMYNWGIFNGFFSKTSVLYGNNPVGATFFRKRVHYTKYINMIAGKIVYLEDKPISLLHLYNGGKVAFYDRPFIWYEYGTGISTSGNEKWTEKLRKDNESLGKMLLSLYPKNRIIRARYGTEKLKKFRYLEVKIFDKLMVMFSYIFRIKKNIIKGREDKDLYRIINESYSGDY